MAVRKTFQTEKHAIAVSTFAGGLGRPWGIAFLPKGGMLVTEKGGDLRRISPDGRVFPPIGGMPAVDARDQGGLLDIALHPAFGQNRLIYWSFSEPGAGGNCTAVARGVLSENARAVEDVEIIFRQEPRVDSTLHFGSRLVFDRDGRLFVTLGERFMDEFRRQAQDLGSLFGKIVRINDDGSIPDDNPFVGRAGARPEIWSYGHRNSQGAAIHPETGALWESEHGPMGGDEINIPRPGRNYGWPLASFGVNYDGTPVGTGEAHGEGIEDPIYQWTPVIAAAGIAFCTSEAFPGWRGNLLVAGLLGTIARLELDGETVTHEERLLESLGLRIRDVKIGPDGSIFALTDEPHGEILRITPAG